MHVDISLDERQADACAAYRALRLIEAFEQMGQFLLVDALARIAHGDGEVMVGMLHGGGYASSLGCVLQSVGHQIEVDVLNLVAVGNDDVFVCSCRGVVAGSTGGNHNDSYLASCSRCSEVFSPSGQFLVDGKSVESQP